MTTESTDDKTRKLISDMLQAGENSIEILLGGLEKNLKKDKRYDPAKDIRSQLKVSDIVDADGWTCNSILEIFLSQSLR